VYLHEHPSVSYTLARLGAGFADYLQRSRPDDPQAPEEWVDFMIEIARFEWRVYEIFDRRMEDGGVRCVDLSRYRFPVSGYYRLVTSQPDTEELPEFPPPVETHVALVRGADYRIGIHTIGREQFEHFERDPELAFASFKTPEIASQSNPGKD
jgi:hypothetical protein